MAGARTISGRTRIAAAVLLAAIAVLLAALVSVLVAIWLHERGGCWPWQERVSRAGGITCDGEPARFGEE